MAKTISSLNVILGATVAPLVNAFKTAETASESLTSALWEIASPIAALDVITDAFEKLKDAVDLEPLLKEQSEAIDSSTNLADRLGITTAAMAGIEHAGALAGIGTEQLADGLGKMLKSIADAEVQGGDAASAFKNLGLDLSKIATERPEDAFTEIAEALSKIQNPAARAYEAVQIFGKSGQELLPMMLQGARGIEAARKEADELGLSFSRVDGAKVQEANEAMLRVQESVMGVARQIVIAIAPAVQVASDLLTDWGEGAVAVVKDYLPGIANIASAVFGETQSIITGAWNAIYGFTAPFISGLVGWIEKNWETMLDTEIEVWSAVLTEIETAAGAIWSVVTTVGSSLVDAWGWAMNSLGLSTSNMAANTGASAMTFIGVFKATGDAVALIYNSMAFGIQNFGLIFEYALVNAAAEIVTFGNQVSYIVTGVIAPYLEWLGTNWLNIFTTIGSFTGHVFENMAANAGNFFTGLWSWMKGDGFNFKWTGLTEGFKSTLTDLPTIAERQMGGLEKSLNDQSSTLGNAIGTGYSDFLKSQDDASKANAEKIKTGVSGVADWIHNAFNQVPKIPTPVIKPALPFDIDTNPAQKHLQDVKDKTEDLKIVFAGSAEAMQMQFAAAAEENTVDSGDEGERARAIPLPSSALVSGNDATATSGADDSLAAQMLASLNLIYQYITNGTNGVPVHIIADDTAPEAVDI